LTILYDSPNISSLETRARNGHTRLDALFVTVRRQNMGVVGG